MELGGLNLRLFPIGYFVQVKILEIYIYQIMPKFIVSTEWKWQTSTLPIRKKWTKAEKSSGQTIYQIISEDIQLSPLDQKLKIEIDKQFPFEQGVGFIWHKSWNLPEIKIAIDDLQNQHLREEYIEVGCEMMAVYPVKNGKFYYLQEVGLNGSSSKLFDDNRISLKFMKFAATSFSHNRNKFCLLVTIYGKTQQGDKHDLFSIISSPIYVDSRKQARKRPIINPNMQICSPKNFFTQICNKKNSQFNTPGGFLSYYGSQNIRNKVKHYFYLGYHFEKVFTICRNRSMEAISNILELITVPNKVGESYLLIIINAQNDLEKKKILSLIQKWKYWGVEFNSSDSSISKQWKPMTKDQLRSSYRTYYERQVLKEQEELEDEQSESEDKNQDAQKQNQFELRTIIDVSRGRKRIKLEEYNQ